MSDDHLIRRGDAARLCDDATAEYSRKMAEPGGLSAWAQMNAKREAVKELATAIRALPAQVQPAPVAVEPATPAARWREKGEPDPHGTRYDCERAKLAKGHLTDDELANGVYMADRTSLDLIIWQSAAKDRIRWLSRALEAAITARPVAEVQAEAVAGAQPLVKLSEEFITAVWHLMDNSESTGPVDDQTITVWQPDFEEVSRLLDQIEGLPSGSTDYMTAGELFAANLILALTPSADALDRIRAEARKAEAYRIAEMVRGWRNDIPMTGEECADTILALIKESAHD